MANNHDPQHQKRTDGETQPLPLPDTLPTPQTAPPTLIEIHQVPLELIDQGTQLIRQDQHDDEITELAADIAAHGLLQPIGVAPLDTGRYQLLFGARRLLAHHRLRRTTIPATFHTIPEHSVRATAARENLLRRNLTLQEECDVVSQLHHDEHRSPDQIASLLSRSRSWVLRRLAIPNLPPDIGAPLLEGVLSLGHAEALALVEDPGLRSYALNQTRAATLSVSETKQMVEALRANPSLAEAVQAGITTATNPTPNLEILSPCAACKQPRPLEALTIIRVCRDGCPTTETDHDTPQHH